MLRTGILTVIAAAASFAVAQPCDAQSLGDRMKKKAKEAAEKQAEERAAKRAGEAANAAMNKAEDVVKCLATDKPCQDKAKADGKKVEIVTDPAQTTAATAATATPPAAAAAAPAAGATPAADGAVANNLKPGEGAWANYDFKPGDRILFAEDFSKDEVGDFPRRMEFKEGAMEIVEWQGTRLLRATSDSRFFISLPEVLPQRYTIEMDAVVNNGDMWIWFGDDQNKRVSFGSYYHHVAVQNAESGISAKGHFSDRRVEQLSRLRLLVDGNYMKVYVDDRRILNVPNANMQRSNKISFWIDAADKYPALIGNIRIAAGGKKLYDALTETGRVATQGIYFDVGSDRIRPESTPTLKEIAAMIKEHPDLKLTIEGHTDNVGAAAANQTLSDKRAAAVKAALVSQFGIEDVRLSAKGLGATKPVASNDTAEGRQQNRRVELVKM